MNPEITMMKTIEEIYGMSDAWPYIPPITTALKLIYISFFLIVFTTFLLIHSFVSNFGQHRTSRTQGKSLAPLLFSTV